MAFPKILQKLFQSDGAGPKLRTDIIPVDSALSATSTNAVQNKVIKSALDALASADSALSATSTNAVQNKVIKAALDSKLDIKKPTAGELLLNYGQGGWLTLLGKDFNRADKGGFVLGTTGPTLAGKPDGTLTWNGQSLLTEAKAKAYVTETWSSGTSWYRKWSDGWIEQGGNVYVGMYGTTSVTLNKAMTTTTYTVVLGNNGGVESSCRVSIGSETKISITRFYTGNSKGSGACFWYACGY